MDTKEITAWPWPVPSPESVRLYHQAEIAYRRLRPENAVDHKTSLADVYGEFQDLDARADFYQDLFAMYHAIVTNHPENAPHGFKQLPTDATQALLFFHCSVPATHK